MKKENILVVALILMAVAGVLIYNFSKTPEENVSAAVTPEPSQGKGTGIAWHSYGSGLAAAKSKGKNVFLYFHAPWCTYCTKLKKYTFTDKKVQALMDEHFVSISVDTDQNQALAQEWKVKGLPTMWFLEPDGSKISNIPGYIEADQMVRILEYIRTKSYETMSFHDFVRKS
ncbi:thioredoxin family protein [Desulfospira joergensenii]|uniref:thioredoxin family protein n=1 Tax=Desulfospira joergensenii TaxID=53329 RepID=UPI0003B2F9EF|nr:thioredoxin fold domain-containing protein [Desulfospira joergensenii]